MLNPSGWPQVRIGFSINFLPNAWQPKYHFIDSLSLEYGSLYLVVVVQKLLPYYRNKDNVPSSFVHLLQIFFFSFLVWGLFSSAEHRPPGTRGAKVQWSWDGKQVIRNIINLDICGHHHNHHILYADLFIKYLWISTHVLGR